MRQMRVQVSYLRQDEAFYLALVRVLQQAGADVWNDEIPTWDELATASHEAASLHEPTYEQYDEDDLWDDEPVPWDETIASSYDEAVVSHNEFHDDFEVRWDDQGHPLFSMYSTPFALPSVYVVLLSQAAFASEIFKGTISWLSQEVTDDPVKLVLVVTAGPIASSDVIADQDWKFLSRAKRIEAPDGQPLPLEEAVRRTLGTLCLTPAGEVPMSPTPQPRESTQDLLLRGNALFAQERYTEALAFFEQATRRAPQHFAAWFNLGYTLFKLKRWSEVVAASEQATTLDPTFADAWIILGAALDQLKRSEAGLVACERALALKSHSAFAWSTKGNALCHLSHYDEALAAYNQALLIDHTYAAAWNNKGVALSDLKRYQEALDAANRAVTYNRNVAALWDTRGEVLHGLQRDEEALHCFDQAIALDPHDGYYWKQKAVSLHALGSTAAAEEAERRAQELGG